MAELIENIDIGGPTMIRAAAKNYQDVAVVTSCADYAPLIEELRASDGSLSRETHWNLAKKAFATTAAYDRAIPLRLAEIPPTDEPLPATLDIRAPRSIALRYGENPHQSAALYATGKTGIAGAEQLHGKELSYNNLVDLDAAWQLIGEFDGPASAIIKHTNPCGCAESATLGRELSAARLKPIRSRRSAACWRSIAMWMRRRPERLRRRSSKRLPRRLFRSRAQDSDREEESAPVAGHGVSAWSRW